MALVWKQVESPFRETRSWLTKRAIRIRAAIVLLVAAWFMKPDHFRSSSKSMYRNLGWWVPLIPAQICAWAMQPIFSSMNEKHHIFPDLTFLISNIFVVAAGAYALAMATLAFHVMMCFVGQLVGAYERPPPYEFFLIRVTAVLMWFALAVSLMMVPIFAMEGGAIGYVASMVQAFPLVWGILFMIARWSWHRPTRSGKVGLKEMYQSKQLVDLIWRTEIT